MTDPMMQAVTFNGPGLRLGQACELPQQRCLARPIGSAQQDQLAWGSLDGDIAKQNAFPAHGAQAPPFNQHRIAQT